MAYQRHNSSWHISFLMGIVALVPLVVSGCKERQKGPFIFFEQETYDCGTLHQRQAKVVREFVFWNKGTSPLRILGTKTSCTCSVANISSTPILPGDSGKIVVETAFRPSLRKQSQAIIVHTNDPQRPTVRLLIKALMDADIAVDVASLNFGEVRPSERAELEFEVRLPERTFSKLTDVIEFVPSSDNVSVEISSKRVITSQIGKVSILRCVARFHPNRVPGRVEETLLVRNRDTFSTKEIPVIAQVVGNLQIEPKGIFLGLLEKKEAVETKIKIMSTINSEFNITDCGVSSSAFKITANRTTEAYAYELLLTVFPEKLEQGLIRAEAIISTDDQLQPIIHIPITGMVL